MKIKRRTLQRIGRWSLIILVVTLIASAYHFYVVKDWFTIYTYSIQGVDEETKAALIPRLKEVSQGASLFIFPNDKILSYSHKNIVEQVSLLIPSRRNVIIRATGLHEIAIDIEEFVPVMKISDTQGVTKEGVVFSTKKSLEGLPFFASASTTESFRENGFEFMKLTSFDASYIESLSLFLEKVSTVLFPVTTIAIDDKGDVTLYSNTTSRILLTKSTDLDKAWSTLVSALDTDPLKSSLQKEKEKLLYIDLRFGNKVFYKFGEPEFQYSSSTGIIDDHAAETATTTSE